MPSRLVDGLPLFLVFLVLATPLAAAPFGVSDEELAGVLAELGEDFEILELRRGWVLRPLGAAAFEVIELNEDGVFVDHEARTGSELTELIGDDADLILALTGDGDRLAAARARLEEERQRAQQLEASIRKQMEELEALAGEAITVDVDPARERMERGGTRVSFGSSLTIEAGESARDVVVIFGSLEVRGQVRGDTAVIFGSVEIDGQVEGNVTVVGGRVSLGPRAAVEGEVISVGGSVHREPGARVEREITEVAFAPLMDWHGPASFTWGWPLDRRGFDGDGWRVFELIDATFKTVILSVLVLAAVFLARHRVSRVAERVRHEPWKAGFVGLLVEVLIAPIFLVVSILLVISVVGIPLLFILLPLACLVLFGYFVLGYAGVSQALGEGLGGRLGGKFSPFVAVLLGLALIQVWQLFGEAMAFAGGFVKLFAVLLIVFGFLIKYVAWTVGLGSVVLDRWAPRPALATLPDLES